MGGEKQAEHRGLQGSERPLPRPLTLNIRHRLFVQSKHDSKREPDMTHGLWVITMCHCRAIDCHTVSLEYVMAAAAETGCRSGTRGSAVLSVRCFKNCSQTLLY